MSITSGSVMALNNGGLVAVNPKSKPHPITLPKDFLFLLSHWRTEPRKFKKKKKTLLIWSKRWSETLSSLCQVGLEIGELRYEANLDLRCA